MNREIGEVILNMPVFCDDEKVDVSAYFENLSIFLFRHIIKRLIYIQNFVFRADDIIHPDYMNFQVNLVLFEKFIVLFPNNRALLYSSAQAADTHIEKLTRIIGKLNLVDKDLILY